VQQNLCTGAVCGLLRRDPCVQGHRLETAETAEFKYEKSATKAAPVGWEAFNQRTKAEAYDKRADKISVDLEVRTMSGLGVLCPRSRSGAQPHISDDKSRKPQRTR